MEHTSEIERYVKDPDLLLKLLQDLIEVLESDDDQGETSAMEAQLREISKAMQKLEKISVFVPDALRAEKTRLAAALGTQSKSMQELTHLSYELEKILKDLKINIGRDNKKKSTRKTRSIHSHAPKTEKGILREHIVDALKHLGGSAHKNDVLKYMERKLEGKLLPGDLERRETTNDYVWQNNAAWERYEMAQDGILKTGSPRGMWELSEEYK
jgi:hypothetical protein